MNGKSDGLIPTVPILFVLLSIIVKAIPQINAFVINMELKILIGLVLLLLFLTPINEFLLDMEQTMLDTLGGTLQILAGA